MKQDWTDVMREKLQESAATPPSDLWPDISSRLDKAAAPVWRWVAAAAACVAVLLGGGIYLAGTKTDVANVAAVSEERVVSVPTVAQTTVGDSVQPVEHAVAEARAVPVCAETIVVDSVPAVTDSPDTTVQVPAVAEKRLVAKKEAPAQETESAPTPSRRRLSLSLYACNSNVTKKSGHTTFYAYNGGDQSYGNGQVGEGQNEAATRGATTTEGCVRTGVHHKLPVKFGATVRLPLSKSFSLSTGLTYSRLSSTLTWLSFQSYEFKTDQTLHYVGIPLSVDYNLPSYKRLSFYLTAGGVAEKCVYGTTTENAPTTERISEKQLQFSLFAGAGVQYNFTRTVGLYVEPLASYYFDNHSAVSNIYKDRPLNLDLRLGLRFTLH